MDLSRTILTGLEKQIDALRDIGNQYYRRGWSVGTSSNYSIKINQQPLELLITASGKDKGNLSRLDFVRVDANGQPTATGQPKSSAETLLHTTLVRQPGIGSVLHTHSIWGTLLSDLFFENGGIEIQGYEMLKGLAGVETHEYSEWVPIFENTQDMPALAAQVSRQINNTKQPLQHAYLIRRHGLYSWGQDLDEAKRHIEIFEFLFECIARRLIYTGAMPFYEPVLTDITHRIGEPSLVL